MEDPKYFLKRPDGKSRKSFALICYIPITSKKKEYLDLPDSLKADVQSINKQMHEKVIDESMAEVLLNELINVQYRKSKILATVLKAVSLSEANSKVLNRFWTENYEVRYHADDGRSARNDFERTFRAIEPHSIQSASQVDLHVALKKNLNVSQVRRAVARLNEVLKWLKRDFKLTKPKKSKKTITHITKAEVLKIAPLVECPECMLLTESLFATGLRIGESMVLLDSDLNGMELSVTKQRVNYGKKLEKLPKREKTGTIAVFEFGLKALKRWIAVKDKWAHREHFGEHLAKGCAAAKVKRITPHDLRHSHAIHILTIGGNLSDVSLNLRDRIEVCQEYYTGYSHSEGTLERLKRLTAEKKSD